MKQLQEILKPYFIEGQTEYDITNIISYFSDKGCIGSTDGQTLCFSIFENQADLVFWAEIPNKPLYLYTEQEEKDLLDLLLKIK